MEDKCLMIYELFSNVAVFANRGIFVSLAIILLVHVEKRSAGGRSWQNEHVRNGPERPFS